MRRAAAIVPSSRARPRTSSWPCWHTSCATRSVPSRLPYRCSRRPNHRQVAASRARFIIGRQVQHLSRLVNDLLEVGRVVTGKIGLERHVLDFCDLVRRTSAVFTDASHSATSRLPPRRSGSGRSGPHRTDRVQHYRQRCEIHGSGRHNQYCTRCRGRRSGAARAGTMGLGLRPSCCLASSTCSSRESARLTARREASESASPSPAARESASRHRSVSSDGPAAAVYLPCGCPAWPQLSVRPR